MLPLILLFSRNRAKLSSDFSPPATSYINHFLSVSRCGHIAPCCISHTPISLSQQSIYCTGQTWRLDVNKVMSACSGCNDCQDKLLIRSFSLTAQLKLGLWFTHSWYIIKIKSMYWTLESVSVYCNFVLVSLVISPATVRCYWYEMFFLNCLTFLKHQHGMWAGILNFRFQRE